MMKERLKNQSGVSLIAAIFIIVILAFMGLMFLTLLTSTSVTSINELQSTRAFYVAEGGVERAVRLLNSPILDPANPDRKRACIDVSTVLTNISLGSGQFSVSQDGSSPYYLANAPTLSAPILAATPSPIDYIQISSSNGLAVFGRVMIDRELFDYTSISSIAAECGGSQPCLRGVIRARDGATAAQHVSGTRVGQNQCTVTSTGGIYNLTTPNARRQVREGIQLQEGWAVGDGGVILRWNGTSWVLFTTTGTNLRGISMDSYTHGWTVGELVGGEAQIRGWNPDGTPAWDLNNYPDIIRDAPLNAVHALSHNEAWAVGNDRTTGSDSMVMHWDGTDWLYVDPTGNFDRNLNGLFVLDTDNDGVANDGWAVGNNGSIRRGMTWGAFASPTGEQLNSVFMSSVNNGWIVGDRSGGGNNQWTFLRWNGVAWNLFAVTTGVAAQNLNSVFMVSSIDGWAVANRRGCVNPGLTILRWNGANWACQAGLPVVDRDLNSIICINENDCWAVGDAGTILHWDGSSWSVHSQSGVVTAQNLLSISMIGPKQRPQAMWREVFQ